MRVYRAIITAFGCFSTVPMPQLAWDDDNMRFMLAAFPLVGVVIGALLWLWGILGQTWSLGSFLIGVGYALIPLVVTGGIHLDGLADVIDALSSHAEPERKREILKDPHVGAFAIMGVCGYLMAFAALAGELSPQHAGALAFVPVVSRCLSGWATISLRPASTQGMLAAERAASDRRVVRIALVALWLAATTLMGLAFPQGAALASTGALLTVAAVARMATRQFGGMSGDLAGFLLQAVELVMLACLVAAGRVW